MAGKKQLTPMQQATKSILESKGIDFRKWKKEQVDALKVKILSNDDKQWNERLEEHVCEEYVLSNIPELITQSYQNKPTFYQEERKDG